jgi:hypothetical protein
MSGRRRTEPLLAICQRRVCAKPFPVRCPADLAKRKYCSPRCNALVNQNIRGAGRIGGRVSGQRRQQRLVARVAGLTPLEAFRTGYTVGLQSKLRQIRRRYTLIPRETQ